MKKQEFNKLISNTVIHCPTRTKAKAVLMVAVNHGLRWGDGDPINPKETFWEKYGKQTCYNLTPGHYGSMGFYRQGNNTIMEADDFLKIVGND